MAVAFSFRDLTPFLVYLLLLATVGPLLFGYHLAELNAPQDVITCVKKDIIPSTDPFKLLVWNGTAYALPKNPEPAHGRLPQCIPMNPAQFGLITSFFTLGGLLGALSGGAITSKYGRLRAMMISGAFATAGPVCEALTPNIGVFALGRLISGIAAGSATVIVPIYISEIAPPDKRGFFGTLTQVMINVGILTTQVLGLFLSKGQLWRIIVAVAGGIAAMQTVCLLLTGQESPKWMANNGKPTQAKTALRRIRGPNANVEEEISTWGLAHDPSIQEEERTLLSRGNQSDSEDERSPALNHPNSKASPKTIGFLGVIRTAENRPAVFAVVMIMLAQQFCGINSIIMYGVGLLSDLLAANSALLNVGVAVLNIIVTIISAPLVERFGRKPCLLSSISGMGISSVLLGIGIMKHVPILSAIAVVLFVASFGLGLGPVPFILSSELVGAEAVGATQGWALGANWIATFIVAQFFPVLNAALGKGQVYFIFAALALVFGVFTAWFVPETKGKRNADEVWGRTKTGTRQD